MSRRDAAVAAGILALAALAVVLALYATRTETPTASPSPTVAVQTSLPIPTTPAPSPTERPTASPQPGAITGRLEYPSEGIPPLTVYAISSTDQRIWYSVDVAQYPNPAQTRPPGGTFAPGTEPRYTITGVAPARMSCSHTATMVVRLPSPVGTRGPPPPAAASSASLLSLPVTTTRSCRSPSRPAKR